MAPVLPSSLDTILPNGANSFLDPRLPAGSYCRGWNIVIRGGTPATRPGTKWHVNFPSGKLQGSAVFRPRTGYPEIIAVVDGSAYASRYPFREYRKLNGIHFSSDASTVFFEQCQQSNERNADGSIKLIDLKNVLMMQDGLSAPGFYDGHVSGHISGVDATPQGSVMKFSNGRLWVACRDRVKASDFGNPFSFIEQYYLGGSDSLLMPGEVTAMAETPSGVSQALLIFTAAETVAVQAFVPREQWLTTDAFQYTAFPDVGCLSAKAVTTQSGLLYWYSQRGLVSLDSARQSRISSVQLVLDHEMVFSKKHIRPELHQIALASHENYLLVSVPHGGNYNTHTWVLDMASIQTVSGQSSGSAWASIWTGNSPAEWLTIPDLRKDRLFAVCPDGSFNRAIEFFRPEKTDSGVPIECGIELRVHTAESPVLKQFEFAFLSLVDVSGTVDFAVDWRGMSRGAYKRALTRRFRAAQGSLRSGESVASTVAFKKQFRRVRTEQIGSTFSEADGTTKDRESDLSERWDWGFQFLISWSGDASLSSVEPVFTVAPSEARVGECASDETAEVFTNAFGISGDSTLSISAGSPIYQATAQSTLSTRGITISSIRSASSRISELAAFEQAGCAARAQAAEELRRLAPLVYGFN